MRSSNSQPPGAAPPVKEPDPEVQALLDEGTGATLPRALVEQGWGQSTMRQMIKAGQRPPAHPSTEQQPVFYEECVQCGRPITMSRRSIWMDHAGREYCTADLVDERISHHHTPQADYDLLLTSKTAYGRRAHRKAMAATGAVCGINKYSKDCKHRCEHPIGHFGFHECRFCKHLWA